MSNFSHSRLALLTKILLKVLPLTKNKEKITCLWKQHQNFLLSSQLECFLLKDVSLTSEYHLRQDVKCACCALLVTMSLWRLFEAFYKECVLITWQGFLHHFDEIANTWRTESLKKQWLRVINSSLVELLWPETVR